MSNHLTPMSPAAPVKATGLKQIKLCPDGKYRWVYEYHMLKNPTILFTTLKVMFIAVLIVMAFYLVLGLFDGKPMEALLAGGQISLLMLGIFGVLTPIAYLIVAARYNWKYIVVFEMDEKGVEHRQLPSQVKKAQAMGWLTALAGLATGNLASAGAGLLAASKTSSYSTFAHVRKVRPNRRCHVIKVDEPGCHNQVYVDDDFDFVLDFIRAHCKGVKGR